MKAQSAETSTFFSSLPTNSENPDTYKCEIRYHKREMNYCVLAPEIHQIQVQNSRTIKWWTESARASQRCEYKTVRFAIMSFIVKNWGATANWVCDNSNSAPLSMRAQQCAFSLLNKVRQRRWPVRAKQNGRQLFVRLLVSLNFRSEISQFAS